MSYHHRHHGLLHALAIGVLVYLAVRLLVFVLCWTIALAVGLTVLMVNGLAICLRWIIKRVPQEGQATSDGIDSARVPS